uniref:RNA polymerase II subunit A C-terminal domain phosphatase SSU72 n=1 Tax=Leptobrachium leishanense TaxID=445787 RepID=A0A8C5WDE1_9ANUR
MTTIKMAALCTPNTYLRTLKPRRARHHAPTGLGRAQPTTLRLRHFPLCRRHFSSCGGREEGGSSAISCWCFVADPAGKASGLSARPFAKMPSSPLRVAVVCSSNQNRSMEAHNILSKRSFNVRSFGTGTHVKLPGPAPDKPNVYDFKTTYEQMYNDLLKKDKELYTQNGILHMLDRNKRIKPRPERFQNCKDFFDLVITCEERVYDQVVEGMILFIDVLFHNSVFKMQWFLTVGLEPMTEHLTGWSENNRIPCEMQLTPKTNRSLLQRGWSTDLCERKKNTNPF